jgi:hypothetical protein
MAYIPRGPVQTRHDEPMWRLPGADSTSGNAGASLSPAVYAPPSAVAQRRLETERVGRGKAGSGGPDVSDPTTRVAASREGRSRHDWIARSGVSTAGRTPRPRLGHWRRGREMQVANGRRAAAVRTNLARRLLSAALGSSECSEMARTLKRRGGLRRHNDCRSDAAEIAHRAARAPNQPPGRGLNN